VNLDWTDLDEFYGDMEEVGQDKVTIVRENEETEHYKDVLDDRAASVSTVAASLYRIDTMEGSTFPMSPTMLEDDPPDYICASPEPLKAKSDIKSKSSSMSDTIPSKKKKGLHLAFTDEPPAVFSDEEEALASDDEEGGYDLRGNEFHAGRSRCSKPSEKDTTATSSSSCLPMCQPEPGLDFPPQLSDHEGPGRLPSMPSQEFSSSSSSSSSRRGVPELPSGRGTATLNALPSLQSSTPSMQSAPHHHHHHHPHQYTSSGSAASRFLHQQQRGDPDATLATLPAESTSELPNPQSRGFWTDMSNTFTRLRRQCACTCSCDRRPAEDDTEELDVMLTNLVDQQDQDAFQSPMEVSLDVYTVLTVHDGNEEDLSSECPVCFEPFLEGEEIRTLPCMHRYHRECIDRWLFKRPICAKCKQSVFSLSA